MTTERGAADGGKSGPGGLSRTVWALGFVSLLTDLATDMIFPLLPAFLVGVLGASAVGLGAIEGIAESTSALVRLVSGRLSDRGGRKTWTLAGYGLSGLVKPLIALVTSPVQVVAIRFLDRVGKGIRSAPRDALLAAEATETTRGRVFGLHRAMDTAGAALGPVVATAVLFGLTHGDLAHPTTGHYRTLFALAAIPAALSVLALAFAVRERPAAGSTDNAAPLVSWRELILGEKRFGRLLLVVGLFTLGNSSDAFPLLRAQSVGIPVGWLPMLWLGFNLIYTATAWKAGSWSDRIGRRRVVTLGLVLYAVAYLAFAGARLPWHGWAAFGLYGLYYGLTEGVLRAMVADLAPKTARGAAYGVYYTVVGLLALPASLIAGELWDRVGPASPFLFGAGLAVVAALVLGFSADRPTASPSFT